MHKPKPNVKIHVVGPVQTGKTIVLGAVKQFLDLMGATVACDAETSATCKSLGEGNLAQWEVGMLRGVTWTLLEETPLPPALWLARERKAFEEAVKVPESVFWSENLEKYVPHNSDRLYMTMDAEKTNLQWETWKLARAVQ